MDHRGTEIGTILDWLMCAKKAETSSRRRKLLRVRIFMKYRK